jgi:MFS family permease
VRKSSLAPKWIYSIVPYKFNLSILSTVLVLFVVSLGGTPTEVGIVVTLSTLGSLLGFLYWTKFVTKSGRYVVAFTIGYVGVFLCYFLLYVVRSIPAIMLVSFSSAFFPVAIYMATAYLINKDFPDNVSEVMGKMEAVGGWGWVAGLLAGSLLTIALLPAALAGLLTIISFISIFLATTLLGVKIAERIVEVVRTDFGLLPLLERGINFVTEQQERLVVATMRGLGRIAKGSIFLETGFPKVGLPKAHLLLHASIIMVYFGFGLIYPQVLAFYRIKLGSDSFAFALSLLGSIISAMLYPKAGKVKKVKELLTIMFLCRALIFFLIMFALQQGFLFALILFVSFSAIDGFTWAFIAILLNSTLLEVGTEEFGINNFLRSLGYIAGGLISGPLLGFGILANVSMASILVMAGALLLTKHKF